MRVGVLTHAMIDQVAAIVAYRPSVRNGASLGLNAELAAALHEAARSAIVTTRPFYLDTDVFAAALELHAGRSSAENTVEQLAQLLVGEDWSWYSPLAQLARAERNAFGPNVHEHCAEVFHSRLPGVRIEHSVNDLSPEDEIDVAISEWFGEDGAEAALLQAMKERRVKDFLVGLDPQCRDQIEGLAKIEAAKLGRPKSLRLP
jgi:hypothetical protein